MSQCCRWILPTAFAPLLAWMCNGCVVHSGALDACESRCGENHLECNAATGYCERIPCADGCPRGTTCDESTDECVLAGW